MTWLWRLFRRESYDAKVLREAKGVRCRELARVVVGRIARQVEISDNVKSVVQGRIAEILFEVATGATCLNPNPAELGEGHRIVNAETNVGGAHPPNQCHKSP
jgi:hypothetical protein